jgi:hypothetical protein
MREALVSQKEKRKKKKRKKKQGFAPKTSIARFWLRTFGRVNSTSEAQFAGETRYAPFPTRYARFSYGPSSALTPLRFVTASLPGWDRRSKMRSRIFFLVKKLLLTSFFKNLCGVSTLWS